MKKTLKELTIKDNFMFGAVMCDERNCKALLEMILHISIARVEVSKEKSILYHPEYKGVRLDVFAKDECNTRYNVEMQAIRKKALGKRARYYHSQIAMELIRSGEDYDKLPDTYVIFICDFDPFGKGKYCYTFANQCLELPDLNQMDGCKSIFLSTKGKNKEEVSDKIVNFLEYVEADLLESEKYFEDEFVKKLQKSVQNVKNSREMEERYMLFEEYLKEERAEARAEGRAEGRAEALIELLEERGTVPMRVREKIMCESNLETLKKWNRLASQSNSVEQFLEKASIV